MKFLYVGLCLFAVAATFRLASQMTHAFSQQKAKSEVLQKISGEGSQSAASIGNSQTSPGSHSKGEENGSLQPGQLSPVRAENSAEIAMRSGNPRPGDSSSDSSNDPDASLPAATSVIGRIRQSDPVRQQSAVHESMITPGNFEYRGAIRPPHLQQNETTFAYGGWALAYRADGDPGGADDGCPGSLFLVGHQNHQKVAEISIPAPVNSRMKRADDLPVAKILQPFSDVTDGILEEMTAGSSEHFHLGGMVVTDGILHWTMHKYYNVANIDYPSHGTSGLNMLTSIADGLWHLGPMNSGRPEWHSYKHAGYVFEVPSSEATKWFGGKNLISGLQISTGLQASSQGPAMFAYSLPTEPLSNASVDAIPLVWYPMEQPLEGHHPADRWSGGAWLTLGDKQTVVILGRKSLGEIYYGEARPQDCTSDKGYHGPPYEVEMLFYSPASLIHAAYGKSPAAGLKPWLRWDGNFEGGGLNKFMFDTCNKYVGGVAYDRERNLLYVVQIDAGKTSDNEYETVPIIHVFHITE